MSTYTIYNNDCLAQMKLMPDNSVDAIVTDPPYGLSFMGKEWDHGVPGKEFWEEALRIAKPGAHILAFGGTRTVHRLACAIEDAGWEIRDRIHWVYGSGFPKSHNISKAIDKAAGAEREIVSTKRTKSGGFAHISQTNADHGFRPSAYNGHSENSDDKNVIHWTIATTPEAQQWDGWGTALKPAVEPIILARKPFKGTVAANVLEWGTGAINVDGCRIAGIKSDPRKADGSLGGKSFHGQDFDGRPKDWNINQGRFPANLIHDGSDEAMAGMGDASRYFYCAKANKKDRGENNKHPTVKPTDLMRYLCRLITPPGGTILDPFMGSGSTGKAALLEDFDFIGIELDVESYITSESRLEQTLKDKPATLTSLLQ